MNHKEDAANNFAPTVHTSPAPSGGYAPMAEINSARLTLKGNLADNISLKIKASTTENEYSTLNTTEKYEHRHLRNFIWLDD